MKVAILSDIHSNRFALEAVLKDASDEGIDAFILLGDFFGYYPWAVETYQIIKKLNVIGIVKGNHDADLMKNSFPKDAPDYLEIILHNKKMLTEGCPESIDWLDGLSFQDTILLEDKTFHLCHGTPEDPSNGRYYPDNSNSQKWFPNENHFLLLGHTHYPMLKHIQNGGSIFNPGSVGQPRDGNPFASWGIWDSTSSLFKKKRTEYDYQKVMLLLKSINWNKRAILALSKKQSGKLNLTEDE